MRIDTKLPGFQIKMAEPEDTPLILSFIKELAAYENLLPEVVADEVTLRQSLFGERRVAEVIIGLFEEKPVGFALYFHNFSTFLGKPGIYIEDIYVKPEMRGRGVGSLMFSYLAKLARERNCGRLEWWVLDWNQPAIDFYKKLGAVPMDEWTVNRLTGEALEKLADEF
jgi:GNAT superfamily N-acetyltransferase